MADNQELRFEFGENWSRFLSVLGEESVAEADQALRSMLGVEELSQKSFLDGGSGTGLSAGSQGRLVRLRSGQRGDDRRAGAAQLPGRRRLDRHARLGARCGVPRG